MQHPLLRLLAHLFALDCPDAQAFHAPAGDGGIVDGVQLHAGNTPLFLGGVCGCQGCPQNEGCWSRARLCNSGIDAQSKQIVSGGRKRREQQESVKNEGFHWGADG